MLPPRACQRQLSAHRLEGQAKAPPRAPSDISECQQATECGFSQPPEVFLENLKAHLDGCERDFSLLQSDLLKLYLCSIWAFAFLKRFKAPCHLHPSHCSALLCNSAPTWVTCAAPRQTSFSPRLRRCRLNRTSPQRRRDPFTDHEVACPKMPR